jgi:error-prone DNA polymerase
MEQYIGFDVSLKDTAISIRQDGKRIWRGKCASDPQLLAQMVRKHAPHAKRVVFETGPLSTWFYHALMAEGLPAICIEARHAQKILSETLNKTDANDADGLAQLAEAGFYKAQSAPSCDFGQVGERFGNVAFGIDDGNHRRGQFAPS